MKKEASSYHPDNLKLVPYPDEAIIKLADLAKELGVRIHIGEIPFGDFNASSCYEKEESENWES